MSARMTIRLSVERKEKLDRLADGTGRSRTYLAAQAVSAYVERELPIVEGIQRGLADVAAGRVTPHEEAMAKVDAMIAEARRKRTSPPHP